MSQFLVQVRVGAQRSWEDFWLHLVWRGDEKRKGVTEKKGKRGKGKENGKTRVFVRQEGGKGK